MSISKSTRAKKPWPTKDAMQQVYENNLWGGDSFAFYSGEGSHSENIVKPYITTVTSFLDSFEEPISACDFGCGDFNVGRNLVKHAKHYSAVDIVPRLIEHNKQTFKAENLEFSCLDIAVDQLPIADCAIVRQVLQHLSNAEVEKVAAKLYDYKYIIITEHIPSGAFSPNADIISGQGTRLKKQSGIDLLQAPFHFKPKESKELLSINLGDKKGVIKTWLYTF